MGNGRYDDTLYHNQAQDRATRGVSAFEYTESAHAIHPSLEPKRILNKPFFKLESRDSVEHPNSIPIILSFDVTGSNYQNAQIAQKNLPQLMNKLLASVTDPQIAIWSNDDARSNPTAHNAIQLSDFESDNRIDESIRNLWLTGNGGGNGGESYDLILYAAARKTVSDAWEKRHKKGYLTLYADEYFFSEVAVDDVRRIFGDPLEKNIPLADIIAEVKEKWNVKILWPASSGFIASRKQYEQLFGSNCVEILESPEHLCDKVASIVVAGEGELVVSTQESDPEFFSRTE